MSQIQLIDFALEEPLLTLWHCGQVCVNESVIVVVDGVLKKEVAKIRPATNQTRRTSLRLRGGLVQTKTWDCNRGRSTNLRFSMIMTTPANRYQKVGVTGSKSEPGNSRWCEEIEAACCGMRLSFVTNRNRPLSIVYSADGNIGQGSGKSWILVRNRYALERALIFLLFLRRRRDLFFFHFSRILWFGINDRGG